MEAKAKTIYSEKFMTKIMKSKVEYERGEYTVVDPDHFWDRCLKSPKDFNVNNPQ
jgi:hypothetical protein